MKGKGESLTKVGGGGEKKGSGTLSFSSPCVFASLVCPNSLPSPEILLFPVRVSCWGKLKTQKRKKMGGFCPLTGTHVHWLEKILVPDYSDQRCLRSKITNIGKVGVYVGHYFTSKVHPFRKLKYFDSQLVDVQLFCINF